MSAQRLFTIAPGEPFLPRLAQALCHGELIGGFGYRADDPLALSQATIYVPTRRAARALRSEFVDFIDRGSAILPTVRTLGENDDDGGFLEEDQPALLDLAPPVGTTERLLELAQLITAWKRSLPKAVSDFHRENRLIAPANPADAVWLARDLAGLLEAMETENRPWTALDDLVGDDYAVWWQLTLEFLKIATGFWPQRLRELGCADPAAHRNAVLHAEAARLERDPPKGPVIIAGSTGSIPATAALMKTVAGLENGAIVLPGLDLYLDADAWSLVGGPAGDAPFDPAICAHPQYGLFMLLRGLGATREEIAELGRPATPIAHRNAVVSTSMMPAQATDRWAGGSDASAEIGAAFEKVELIEAATEREEALAIAIAMRLAADAPPDGGKTVEAPPKQIALVTPDRTLARRVAAELQRFGIDANDSGGAFLAQSPQASLLQLLLQSAFGQERTVALLGLMKHPLMLLGRDPGTARNAARIFERIALRGGTGDVGLDDLVSRFDSRLRERRDEPRHAPHWFRRMSEADFALARDFAARLEAAFQPVISVEETTVGQWAGLSGRLLEEIARNAGGDLDALWGDEAGERLADLIASVMEDRSGFSCTAAEWTQMVPALVAGELVKPRAGGHPHIFIWGALEARLQHVDTLVLAGLNEGTWPANPAGDPFLSRGMKAAVGLEPPERRIGLAAHDFQMGLGAPHVILSRSTRAANAPTVASRWLQRLSAVLGKAEADRLRARGMHYLQWAEALDRRDDAPLASRPAPKPPADLQPKRYSFSEIRTLRRDPYAVYARRVLDLDPPEQLAAEPGPAERGTLYHRILECFIAEVDDLAAREALSQLRVIAEREFDRQALPAHIDLLWRAHFDKIAAAFVEWERGCGSEITARFTECRAKMQLENCGITLSGIADRIDIRTDGLADILDYKTGSSPSRKQAWTLLDPQLPLEAAALRAGAFDDVGTLEPASLAYVRLKPDPVLKVERIEGKVQGSDVEKSPADLADESVERLGDLVTALAAGRIGFVSQAIPESATSYGHDYDHLARVREWSSADADESGAG
ncbi:double-strand break repair protein AddB [Hoeflea poritis]|uniref:Double-strand break repair protein AddB n=1 Tax=Hoeflea poritis TaxID=2993659 RepID=A0ABT4VKU6_9HYPH|nr:double-strand break repair protein AddB [Hoeflea poritis]MDA4845309.1 double-strand break repair protein AddB [Hoeflea poritis]